MWKKILGVTCVFLSGALVGYAYTKKHYEDEFDDIAREVYNECYREAMEDIKQEIGEDLMKKSDGARRIVDKKPPLKEFVIKDKADYQKLSSAYLKPFKPVAPEDQPFLDQEMEEKRLADEAEITDGIEEDEDEKKDGVYFISEHDFSNSCPDYNKEDIFYYCQDGIMTDENDQLIDPSDHYTIFGDLIGLVKHKILEQEVLYLRNDRTEVDYEIYGLDRSFQEIAFETAKERERRRSKRKHKSYQ